MTKKGSLAKLALLGMTSGTLTATPYVHTHYKTIADAIDIHVKSSFPIKTAHPKMITERELLPLLSEKNRKEYLSMDAEGRALCLKLASQTCSGQNQCKGQNSCAESKNSCYGGGTCKGTTPGPFDDKNMAVETAAMCMKEKRERMMMKNQDPVKTGRPKSN